MRPSGSTGGSSRASSPRGSTRSRLATGALPAARGRSSPSPPSSRPSPSGRLRERRRTIAGVRVAVLADVHGNLPALRAVLAEVDRAPVEALVVAGDVVAGPLVRESLELVAARPEPV